MKKLVTLSLLALALAIVPVLASAQATLTQFPTVCVPGGTNSQFIFAPQGGAYASALAPGLYNCIGPNQAALFGGGGASKLLLLSDVSATTVATTVFTFPILANTNYTFDCSLFWQSSTSTAGDNFSLVTPASPTSVLAYLTSIYTTAGAIVAGVLTGSPLALSGGTAGAGSTTYKAVINGGIQNGTTAGGLSFQVNGVSGNTATVKAGSYCAANSAP